MYLSYDESGNLNGSADSNDGMPNSISAPEGFDPATFDWSAWRVIDGQLVPASNDPPPPPRILTKYGFRSLLTLAEQVVLDNFDDPEYAAVHPVLSQFGPTEKAILRTAVKAYETAEEINLDDRGLIAFVGALAHMHLLEGDAEARVARILSGYAPEDGN
ncbi:MAG: hypothetical protein FWG81_02260 [Betaproteobacteria bacterium]|nr:hypothetical protein [Betaproteobacteria bacterium]